MLAPLSRSVRVALEVVSQAEQVRTGKKTARDAVRDTAVKTAVILAGPKYAPPFWLRPGSHTSTVR